MMVWMAIIMIFYSKQVYETNAARMMTDTMTYVMTDGTGRKHNLKTR